MNVENFICLLRRIREKNAFVHDILGQPSYTVVWQEEHVGLIDLVWHRYVKHRPWYVPWDGKVDLPDGLFFEHVLGRQSLPVTSGTVVNACGRTAFYLAPLGSARYSSSPISLQHAEGTGP